MAQLLVWFVLLFYVPTLLFRFVATQKVDLAQRKIANQIENFFAAALPSVFLNILTMLILNTVTFWWLAEVSALPLLLITEQKIPPAHFSVIAVYYISLLGVSAASGWIYGVVELKLTLYGPKLVRQLPGEWRRATLWYHDFWEAFFRREKMTLFPWTVKPTWVFVRTTDRLFHGLLETYDKTSEGEVAGILLRDVHRLNTRDEALKGNVDFAVKFSGSLWIRWSSITDINTADVDQPRTLERLISEFEARKNADANTFRNRLRKLVRLW